MNWKQEYEALRDYIVNHAEIIINQTEISIPQTLRDEFYRRFDDLRKAAVEEHCSAITVDFNLLSESYVKIEKEILELLGLDAITVPMDLHTFVHSPKDGLMRILYTRTFDLLQGKITAEDFYVYAGMELQSAAAELFRLGYEQWVALVMLKLLDPDQAFLVDLDEDYKPCLRELKTIAFGRQAHHPTMRIPEFVLHSRKLDKYVAVKMVLAREIETYAPAVRPPVRPRKKTGDTSLALDSRVMLLSLMKTPEDIPIIADIYDLKLTSPDFMMEFISQDELEDPDSWNLVDRNLRALSPRMGMCLVLVGGDKEAKPENVPDGVHPVSVAFDESRLQPVVDSFTA
jgi:hypothetical protein